MSKAKKKRRRKKFPVSVQLAQPGHAVYILASRVEVEEGFVVFYDCTFSTERRKLSMPLDEHVWSGKMQIEKRNLLLDTAVGLPWQEKALALFNYCIAKIHHPFPQTKTRLKRKAKRQRRQRKLL